MARSLLAELQARPSAVAFLIGIITVTVLALNGYYLTLGITTVLPHLFYIPIILTAYFFPRRGLLFALIISAIYCVMSCIVSPEASKDPLSAIGRIVIFILIAAVVSFLTLRTQESERQFRGVAERSSDIILLTDADGRARYVSPSIMKILGYDPAEITGHMPYEFIHPDDHGLLNNAISLLGRGSAPAEITVRMRRKDGAWALVEFSGTMIVHGGRPSGIQVIGRDITERRRQEEAIRTSEANYRMLADYTYDWEYWIAPDETMQYTTPSCERITGYTAAEFAADKNLLKRIIHPEDGHALDHHMVQGFTEPKAGAIDFRIIRRDGEVRWIGHVCQPIYAEDGSFRGRRASNRDITGRKQLEAALHETNKKLNLLSGITRHDINNQLFSLKAFLTLAKESLPGREETMDLLKKAVTAAEAIEHQIAFTREYQNLGVRAPSWQEVSASIRDATVSLPLQNIRVSDETGGIRIYADPLFGKVFYNLIDNALRYGGPSMTSIRFSCHGSEKGLIIVVEDDGVGIAAEDRARLFERGFGRNTGLGLFLSREILAITGITINETGGAGTGARFEIVVPNGAWQQTGRT